MCFLFIFCGVLDVCVMVINDEMKVVVVEVFCVIMKEFVLEEVLVVSKSISLIFGKEYIIFKFMDLCLCECIVIVVFKVVIEFGVVCVFESLEE